MNSSRDDSSSDERGTSMTSEDTKNYHRHTNFQIQRLEAYFKECPHPDELQRRKLGEELQLKPKQIKFWFQNKRTQVKALHERADNAALREENRKIIKENEVMHEALKTVLCPPCGGPSPGSEERERSLQTMRLNNVLLKQEHERLVTFINEHGGSSSSKANVDSSNSRRGPPSYAPTVNNNRPALYGTTSNHLLERPSLLRGPYTYEHINTTTQPPQPRKPLELNNFQLLNETEKMMLAETGTKAVAEVIRLIQVDEPMWYSSSIDGRLVIDQENYEKVFAKLTHFKSPNPRIESSKDVVVVPMEARNLVAIFFDTEQWARLFPTIVNESKTIQVLQSMDRARSNFSILIYEDLHILSPLVPHREFMILRSCKQIGEDLWVIADVSCHLPNVDFDFGVSGCSKRPSGCLIQGFPNGYSKVMWMEHVEVNDKVKIHRLYKDLLCGGSGYGARRWTVTLERMCQRISLYSISAFSTNDYGGVVKKIEGRRSIMSLGQRLLRSFAWILKMSEKFDFSQLSETNNSGVRVSVRTNTDAGQPAGLIVCASSSLCVPLSPIQVYTFLRSIEVRHQWDVLCHGNPAVEVARFATGTDQKNYVHLLQPTSETEPSEMMILQDGFMDALGGMVVYAPVDLNTAYAAISGQVNPGNLPILPSGFIISRDGHPSPAEVNGGDSVCCATLLTVAFQILVSGPSYSSESNMQESTATVDTLISSTVQRIKAMLNCDDGPSSARI